MTSGADLIVSAWRLLDPDERAAALGDIQRLHQRDLAGTDSEMAMLLDGLQRAAEHLGAVPTPDSYMRARTELAAVGVMLPPRSRIMRRFDNWYEVKEALGLYSQPGPATTARRIEARFESRRVAKVWRYSDEVLAQTLAQAVAYWGRPPRVAEFDHWRERELELRRARGLEAPHLPSPHPYRKRWGSWEGALIAHGYEPELIAKRLDTTSLPAQRVNQGHEES